MNWGYSIMLVFALFAVGIITLVTKSIRTKIDMVTPDYYAEELKYQQVIDGRQAAKALSAPVGITQQGDSIKLLFPAEMQDRLLMGKILFYRPSDAGKDVAVNLHASERRVMIPARQLRKGHYLVQVQWLAAEKHYYQETALDIP